MYVERDFLEMLKNEAVVIYRSCFKTININTIIDIDSYIPSIFINDIKIELKRYGLDIKNNTNNTNNTNDFKELLQKKYRKNLYKLEQVYNFRFVKDANKFIDYLKNNNIIYYKLNNNKIITQWLNAKHCFEFNKYLHGSVPLIKGALLADINYLYKSNNYITHTIFNSSY